ncbi:hypothetical protein DPMN_100384 [Dreissena polymorpha]|uniref:Uncharacterized protein n=1 Tax=Dreissena polymorpha TaxID=45954 RepID=A0A9D4LHB3_DREPO|nr:hypothetical protein DPMN_100384 [Dreissena polymorpha]
MMMMMLQIKYLNSSNYVKFNTPNSYKFEYRKQSKLEIKTKIKARSSAAEAARSGPGRIYTRPAGKKHRTALSGLNRTRTSRSRDSQSDTASLAFDNKSLDVSCQLGFSAEAGGNQSNVRGSLQSGCGKIGCLSYSAATQWVGEAVGQPAVRAFLRRLTGDNKHLCLSFILSHASYRQTAPENRGVAGQTFSLRKWHARGVLGDAPPYFLLSLRSRTCILERFRTIL